VTVAKAPPEPWAALLRHGHASPRLVAMVPWSVRSSRVFLLASPGLSDDEARAMPDFCRAFIARSRVRCRLEKLARLVEIRSLPVMREPEKDSYGPRWHTPLRGNPKRCGLDIADCCWLAYAFRTNDPTQQHHPRRVWSCCAAIRVMWKKTVILLCIALSVIHWVAGRKSRAVEV
jgi:hypothetical protein